MIEVLATHELNEQRLKQALLFCGSASKLEASKVGWIPFAAYQGAHDQGRILICFNNDDIVGFCLWQQRFDEVKIYQIWVRQDARLILHGRALCTELATRTIARRGRLIRLWCAQDLAANIFWHSLGFENRGWRWGPKRTSKRRHNLWVKSTLEIISEATVPLPTATQNESVG